MITRGEILGPKDRNRLENYSPIIVFFLTLRLISKIQIKTLGGGSENPIKKFSDERLENYFTDRIVFSPTLINQVIKFK